jgi:prepilin-type N-terminal cleavage/methylation domain-containing protein/prepilin-type processing-associated H-X9-DG protein
MSPIAVKRARGRPAAFTLVELLVVVTIIGMLISVLMPAVQSTRESARRGKCQSNLHQLSMAVLSYESDFGRLPPSGLVANTPPWFYPQSGVMLSWGVIILPYLEQVPLYKQFDLTRTVFDQPQNPQAVALDIMLCPSDSSRGRFFVDPSLTNGKYLAKGNYAAFCCPYHTDLQLLYPGALISTGQPLAAVLDGQSNTLLFSEVRTAANPQDQRGAWAIPWTGASLLAFDMHQSYFATSDRYLANQYSVGLTQRPNNQGPTLDMLYACPDMATVQMEGMPCNVWAPGTEEEFLSAAPRSFHPGGVNVSFLDGHTGFLPDGIDEYTMAYLISINDLQVIDVANSVR